MVRTLEEVPAGATHWSRWELNARVGISLSSVRRIWQAFGLQPYRVEEFKIYTDPLLIDKIRDVVGLYLSCPSLRWSSPPMRSRTSSRSDGSRRCCRWCPALPSGVATTTTGTAPSTFSQR
ncbi:hypothetical protein ACBJ59_26835 [Nonomuraea sp. MTCD27]